ncbi:hypothetical protein BGZ65_011538, partial [Modicella reniformis]
MYPPIATLCYHKKIVACHVPPTATTSETPQATGMDESSSNKLFHNSPLFPNDVPSLLNIQLVCVPQLPSLPDKQPVYTPYCTMKGFAENWKNQIDTSRVGAGYFLSIQGRPEFNPSEYIAFRGLEWSDAQQLLPEWSGWMQDLKNCTYEHVNRRAKSAPAMTSDDIYNFYKKRIVDNHELEILELRRGESSRQVATRSSLASSSSTLSTPSSTQERPTMDGDSTTTTASTSSSLDVINA